MTGANAKIKRIMIGDKQVRPSGWNPGSSTLAYFPFKEDGLDKMGNFTLNNVGTQQTIGRRFTSNCSLNTAPTGAKTIIAWVKANTLPVAPSFGYNIYVLRVLAGNTQLILTDGRDVKTIVPCFYSYYNSNLYTGGSNLIKIGTRNLIAITIDTKMLGYCNGTEYLISNGVNPNNPEPTLVGATNQTPDVVLSEVILESKTWTQSEIQDYYNKTKSNYGL